MTHLNFCTDTTFQSSLVERIINGQTQIHFIFYISNHICYRWRVTGKKVTGMKKVCKLTLTLLSGGKHFKMLNMFLKGYPLEAKPAPKN